MRTPLALARCIAALVRSLISLRSFSARAALTSAPNFSFSPQKSGTLAADRIQSTDTDLEPALMTRAVATQVIRVREIKAARVRRRFSSAAALCADKPASWAMTGRAADDSITVNRP